MQKAYINNRFSPIRHPAIVQGVVITMVVLTAYLTIVTRLKLEGLDDAAASLDQLEADISDANQHLKYAAIAPKEEYRTTEFAQMLITRASATKQYEALKQNKALTSEDQGVVSTMLIERDLYRERQNAVVKAINEQHQNCIWRAFMLYQPRLEVYLTRTRNLTLSVVRQAEITRMWFYAFMTLEGIVITLLVLGAYLWDKWLNLTTRRSCDVQREKL